MVKYENMDINKMNIPVLDIETAKHHYREL